MESKQEIRRVLRDWLRDQKDADVPPGLGENLQDEILDYTFMDDRQGPRRALERRYSGNCLEYARRLEKYRAFRDLDQYMIRRMDLYELHKYLNAGQIPDRYADRKFNLVDLNTLPGVAFGKTVLDGENLLVDDGSPVERPEWHRPAQMPEILICPPPFSEPVT